MKNSYKKAGYTMGAAVFAVALLYATAMPSFGQSNSDEGETLSKSAVEERSFISESEDAFPWPPTNQPATGKPVMRIAELQSKPDTSNRVNLEDARWLQNVIDRPGQRVSMTPELVQEYFQYYEEANNHSRYFEVTFPDGNVKYYAVTFTEEP